MWCGNGRETTCHCGWERHSRTEARPGARPVLQFTFNRSLSLFCSVCLCHLSISLSLSLSLISSSCLLIPLCLSLVWKYLMFLLFFVLLSQCLIFPDLTRGLLQLKECPSQAKAILWFFFERAYFMPLSNIKPELNKWQSWELNVFLELWLYHASNSVLLRWKVPLRVLKMLFNGPLYLLLTYVKQPLKAHLADRTTWVWFCQSTGFMWMARGP